MRKIKKFFSVAAALLFTVYPLSGFSAAGRHEIEIKACMECHGEDGMEI
ncbi:MAG: hypothetical protein FJ088_13205, partial [Deltaproteobacteria bacterium]|nr:hypothetical protein [Deltaproteobacteria bacterium]